MIIYAADDITWTLNRIISILFAATLHTHSTGPLDHAIVHRHLQQESFAARALGPRIGNISPVKGPCPANE